MTHTEHFIESYFRRIGYQGETGLSLDLLNKIHFLHPQAIPFENLNPFSGIPVSLRIEEIYEKVVNQGRGGYCFEQNLLLKAVLEMVGFQVKGLAARVLWNVPEGVTTARGHMLLLIDFDKEQLIADVGFGGLTLTSPLLLKPDIEQATPHEVFRLRHVNDEYIMEAKINELWKPLYRFNLQEQLLPDYEVTSWYLSNKPDSHFVTGLIAARATPDGRYTLRNTEFTKHYINRKSEKSIINDPIELRKILEDAFKITLPNHVYLDEKLEDIVLRQSL